MLIGEPLVAIPLKLVVKHAILSEGDAKKVSKKFKTPLDKFPRILDTDPQAVKIGAKPGQLLEISRKDPAGEYMYYRLVVSS